MPDLVWSSFQWVYALLLPQVFSWKHLPECICIHDDRLFLQFDSSNSFKEYQHKGHLLICTWGFFCWSPSLHNFPPSPFTHTYSHHSLQNGDKFVRNDRIFGEQQIVPLSLHGYFFWSLQLYRLLLGVICPNHGRI